MPSEIKSTVFRTVGSTNLQEQIWTHEVRPEGEVQGCTESIPPGIRKLSI